jgi:hypothetical protein
MYTREQFWKLSADQRSAALAEWLTAGHTIAGGFDGGSSGIDRGNELAASQSDWNLFGFGMPAGQAGQATGAANLSTAMSTLGGPQQYFQNLLTAGRTQTQQNAAPAVDQVLANATATRNAEGTFGTSRTGGTVAANRNASVNTQSQIDNIINTNLNTGRQQGAQGLEAVSTLQSTIGNEQLANSLGLLGLSSTDINDILQVYSNSRATLEQSNAQSSQAAGQAIGSIISAINNS